MVQELPRSASNKQQQQQQQQEDNRGEMPMALMQEMAESLGQMDETGMNGASLLALQLDSHNLLESDWLHSCAFEPGHSELPSLTSLERLPSAYIFCLPDL